MGPVVVNRSVHTAHKQHQRKNIPICVHIASRVLCELGLKRLLVQNVCRGHCQFTLWCKLIFRQSTPESWAQFSHDNISRSEHERMGSAQLRTLIDNVLTDTSRDMLEQNNAVNQAFARRAAEMQDAKDKLQDNLKKVSQDFRPCSNRDQRLWKQIFALLLPRPMRAGTFLGTR